MWLTLYVIYDATLSGLNILSFLGNPSYTLIKRVGDYRDSGINKGICLELHGYDWSGQLVIPFCKANFDKTNKKINIIINIGPFKIFIFDIILVLSLVVFLGVKLLHENIIPIERK